MLDEGGVVGEPHALPVHRVPELQGVIVVLERLPDCLQFLHLLLAQGRAGGQFQGRQHVIRWALDCINY